MWELYGDEITDAAEDWLPGFGPALWASQLYQESAGDRDAVSHAGAQGLAQIMPTTRPEIARGLGIQDNPSLSFDPWFAIHGGAWYEARSIRYWQECPAGGPTRTRADCHKLGTAGYNVGNGWLTRAQRLCDGARLWEGIIPCLKALPIHWREPVAYVERIRERHYPVFRQVTY